MKLVVVRHSMYYLLYKNELQVKSTDKIIIIQKAQVNRRVFNVDLNFRAVCVTSLGRQLQQSSVLTETHLHV